MGHRSHRRLGLVAGLAAAAIAIGACSATGSSGTPAVTAPAVASPAVSRTASPTAAPTVAPASPAPVSAAPAAPVASSAAGTGGVAGGYGYGGYGDGYGSPASATPAATAAPAASPGQGAALGKRDVKGIGTVLVGPTGLTLYMYARDTAGTSVCTGGCASAWPPLVATAVPAAPDGFSGKVTLATRADGTRQVVYDGHPLYAFSGDAAPGDANGQGSGGVWFVVTR